MSLTHKLGIRPNLDRAQEIAVRRRATRCTPPKSSKRLAELLYLAPALLIHGSKES